MLSPGTILGGRYRLDERIAGGGMGDVWRGTDEVLGRTVAVKVLLPALLEEPGFAERFRGEARTMATINHPGVVDIYDYGNENGTAFLIMEYIEGDALSRTLARVGRLTPGRTMALVAQAADALHAAHAKGIVHRDVKPGNLLVRPNGTLVLTDFGIARSAGAAQLTQAGSVLGTASYISPEQAAGQAATPLSDVYALGIVAYQCLSGRRPFEGDNPLEIAMKHVRDQPPPLPPDIPAPARQIVERAMAKDPGARYPTAEVFGQVARQAAGQLSTGTTGIGPAGSPVAMPGSPVAAASGPLGGTPAAPISGMPGVPVSGMPGGPVSGMPGGPVSGPPSGGRPVAPKPGLTPAGPTSGPPGPTSGPPGGPVSAGGTRVLPTPDGQPGPPVAGGPPPPPGQFARGAAGVPPPPDRGSDTGYTYAGTGLVQPGQPHPGAGTPPAPRDRNRTRLFALLAGAGALILILCIGGGVVLVNNLSDDKKKDPVTPATSNSPVARETVDCDGMKNQPLPGVRRHLEETDGFKVEVVEVDAGGRRDTVVDVSPCGEQPKGSTVKVTVTTGKRGPSANNDQNGEPCVPNFLRTCPPSASR
jgi:eukaryotic-like serine/threonine-protein kinase